MRDYLLNNGWTVLVSHEKYENGTELSWMQPNAYTKTIGKARYEIYFNNHYSVMTIKKFVPHTETFSFGFIDLSTNTMTEFEPLPNDTPDKEIVLYTGPIFSIELLKQHYNFL